MADETGFDLARFKRQLAETVAWCGPRASDPDFEHTLRSSVTTDVASAYNLADPVTGESLYSSLTPYEPRQHRAKVCDALFSARAQRLTEAGIVPERVYKNLANGYLLVFDANLTLREGAMNPESHGFFGYFDMPAWDTWVYYDLGSDLLICWIPPQLTVPVRDGLMVMSVPWCWWVTGTEPFEFAQVLKQEFTLSSWDNVSRIFDAYPVRTGKLIALMIVALLLIAWLACYLPWVVARSAVFTSNAFDLAEWMSLNPLVRGHNPTLLPTFLLRTAVGLIAVGLANLVAGLPAQIVRWAIRLLAFVIGVGLLPPFDFFRGAFDDPNYRQQFYLALLTCAAVIVATWRPVRWISKISVGVAIGFIGVGVTQSLSALSGIGVSAVVGGGALVSGLALLAGWVLTFYPYAGTTNGVQKIP